MEIYEARLVALDCYQEYDGLAYDKTFAPTAKLTTVRFRSAVVAMKGWSTHQMDVSNTFLSET